MYICNNHKTNNKMKNFIIIVSLPIGDTEDNYNRIYDVLIKNGYVKYFESNGLYFALPRPAYRIKNNSNSQTISNHVLSLTNSVGVNPIIVVVESVVNGIGGMNLTQIQLPPQNTFEAIRDFKIDLSS